MSRSVTICGTGAVTALGMDAPTLLRGLAEGACGLTVLPGDEASPKHPVGAVDLQTSPAEDRARVLAEIACREALAEAHWSEEARASPRTMLVVATTKAGLNVAERVMEGRVEPAHIEQSLLFALAPRLAKRLGVGGPVHTVSLACASGLIAVGLAREAMLRGEVERALVVGTDALCNFIYRGFLSLQALDPSGARPFDAQRAGLSVGEGAAAVALSTEPGPLSVRGYGATNDANHITGPARDGRGLVKALESALASAAVAAEDVGFGVLHGTATRFNDAMEGVAYRKVFGPRGLPALSVKGAIGHVMGGAGLANLVVAAGSLRAGRVPPSVGVETIDPDIPLDVVRGEARPTDAEWSVTSASGFAGVNAAVVLHAARAFRRSPSSRGAGKPQAAMDDPPVVTAVVDLPPDRKTLVERIGSRSARRLDDLCLFGVAAVDALFEQAGPFREEVAERTHGLVLGTALGCLESDHGFYVRELEPERFDPSPRLFAYTLPNIVLGEAAIRHRLMGENLVLSAGRASGLAALSEAASRLNRGTWEVAVVLVIDAVGPAAERLGVESRSARASAFLLERRASAVARGAPIRGRIAGRVWSEAVGALCAQGGAEPLGAGGISRLLEMIAERRSGDVEVRCPSGYGAQVRLRA